MEPEGGGTFAFGRATRDKRSVKPAIPAAANLYGLDDPWQRPVGLVWFHSVQSIQDRRDSMDSDGLTRVVVTDIRMSFGSMVLFMVKWAIAAIPAFTILLVLSMILTGLFAALTR